MAATCPIDDATGRDTTGNGPRLGLSLPPGSPAAPPAGASPPGAGPAPGDTAPSPRGSPLEVLEGAPALTAPGLEPSNKPLRSARPMRAAPPFNAAPAI